MLSVKCVYKSSTYIFDVDVYLALNNLQRLKGRKPELNNLKDIQEKKIIPKNPFWKKYYLVILSITWNTK